MVESMKVVFTPYWGSENPYQDALAEHLGDCHVVVEKMESLNLLFRGGICLRYKPDLVHLHWLPVFEWRMPMPLRWLAFVLRLAVLRLHRVPLVWTIHNLVPHESRHPRIDWLMGRIVMALSQGKIVHGETAGQEAARVWRVRRPGRFTVIPHPHYIDHYRNDISPADARKQLGIPTEKTVLLFLGMVRPYKGVMALIDAFRRLADGQAFLVIAGQPLNGAFQDEVEQAIAGCADVRFFPGFVANDEVQVYMNAANAVVLPYERTLTSGAVVLATSFGKACIVPRAGTICDVLDEAGAFFYNPGDREGLCQAMAAAVANRDLLTQMGVRNRVRTQEWNWAAAAARTAELYRACLASCP